MKYDTLDKYVKLSQGLAINKASESLVSNFKSDIFSYPLLRIADMMSNEYSKFISKNVNNSVVANKDDIIYTRTGQIGLVFRGYSGVVHNNCFIVKLISKEIDKDYLYCILKSDFVREQALKFSKSSVQPDLTHEMFKNIVIPIPSLENQIKISKIILNLENKIDNNNLIINKFEKIIDLLFDYKFLQLDKSKEQDYVFNDKLNRKIPKIWNVMKISDVAKVSAGGDKPKIYSSIKTTEYSIPIYSNGSDNMGLYGFTNKSTKSKNSITVSARGNIGYTVLRKEDFVPVIRLITLVPNNPNMVEYLTNYLKKINFSKNGSIQQQLVVPQISDIEILIPDCENIDFYHNKTQNMYEKIYYLQKENNSLECYKNYIFPMLINGQIKIED